LDIKKLEDGSFNITTGMDNINGTSIIKRKKGEPFHIGVGYGGKERVVNSKDLNEYRPLRGGLVVIFDDEAEVSVAVTGSVNEIFSVIDKLQKKHPKKKWNIAKGDTGSYATSAFNAEGVDATTIDDFRSYSNQNTYGESQYLVLLKEANENILYGHKKYKQVENKDLVTIPDTNKKIHTDALHDWTKMQQDALKDGITLKPYSAFRDTINQKANFYGKMNSRGLTPEQMARSVAPPGHSEHHTGYTVDINSVKSNYWNSSEGKKISAWMKSNAKKYNFNLSFPEGNSQGVMHEPWHWRWQGNDLAKKALHQQPTRGLQEEAQAKKKIGGELNQQSKSSPEKMKRALATYADYVNGKFYGTVDEKKGQEVYDKLNRLYYKEAKKQGIDVRQYVMGLATKGKQLGALSS